MKNGSCKHKNLILLAQKKERVRCRHCHLTIDRDELRDRWCPECYEATGTKHRDFEKVVEPAVSQVHYACEDCGLSFQVE